ncbi:MAG: type II toxin-antitoxin system death-on-curing family toxin [Gomphosphaeria aponina SAG 52.96 = DSM 107014]|uniref:Type II toxin-antitoxin system death-on-curing family toxin n=1 Tax=Gomphosphaeria aponina SAG 52.96 = DSM 107014 TaxID=1521640 RepID=A0A941JNM6_9CHRO|nr:type II toxin-antitoxin system death-on-curing family toxin [Gomphosphaeria aponina SAG 52.96 = DSM 107014]
MIRYLTLVEVLNLHRQIIAQFQGAFGVRDLGALESAIAQPRMTFGGEDLYPTIVDKAATLGFSIVMNHPFIDGNKRTSHAAMETFLILNGLEINASVDEQERVILGLASSELERQTFTNWLRRSVCARLT